MRSISIKIFLVLLVVSLAGALFTTFYIQFRTRTAFDTFIRDQNLYQLSDRLISHYRENGSWEDVQEVFTAYDDSNFGGSQGAGVPGSGNERPGSQGTGAQGRNPNRQGGNQSLSPPFVLVDQAGKVIAGSTNHPGFQIGDRFPENELEKSLTLELAGDTIGYLAAVPIPPNRNNIQLAFLDTVQQGLLISSLATLLIALVLGGILILSFTRPIQKLVSATERVASGELGYQVEIKSSDELGRLADSFNSMSSDLKRADQSRKQMTADIAHDLRTPLSILHGYTEAMNEGKINGSPEIYQVMHQQAQHLNYLIDDLRTLSLLDSEELNFQIQDIDPENILKQTLAAFQPAAQENGLSISLDIQDHLPRLKLDPDRLTQILGNLISNAVQVLSRGNTIWVKASKDNGEVMIEVKDDGPGISPDDLPHIFDRHYRTDKSRTGETGSSGLGLAITKKLVEALGGRIAIDSELGQGSSFLIHFPAA